MQHWTETHCVLDTFERLTVCPHADGVSLAFPGDHSGWGFTLKLRPADLPKVRELVAALEVIAAATSHTDHNPFHHEPTCPACVAEGIEELPHA